MRWVNDDCRTQVLDSRGLSVGIWQVSLLARRVSLAGFGICRKRSLGGVSSIGGVL
jgi:hypothetical protein